MEITSDCGLIYVHTMAVMGSMGRLLRPSVLNKEWLSVSYLSHLQSRRKNVK